VRSQDKWSVWLEFQPTGYRWRSQRKVSWPGSKTAAPETTASDVGNEQFDERLRNGLQSEKLLTARPLLRRANSEFWHFRLIFLSLLLTNLSRTLSVAM